MWSDFFINWKYLIHACLSASAQLYCNNLSITQCYDSPTATYCVAFSRELLNMKKNKKSLQLIYFFLDARTSKQKLHVMIIKVVYNHQVEEKNKRLKKNQIEAFIFIFELERDERMRFTFHFE